MRVIVFLVQCTEGVCASVLIARDQLDDRPKEHLLIGCYLCEAIDSQLSSAQVSFEENHTGRSLVDAFSGHSPHVLDLQGKKS